MRKKLSTILGFSLNQLGKNFLLPFLLLAFGGNIWGQTITLTQASSGITATGYDSGAERTWTQNSVTFGGKALFKETGQARLQLQANNGVIYNTTAFPGRITGVTINQNGTARNYNLNGGNGRLVNSTSADYNVGGTAVGTAGTSWNATNFTSTNYTFFAIRVGVNFASYITSVVITYEDACPSPTLPTTTAITTTSATLGWTAPGSVPTNGYDYYLSTSSTAPTGSTTPTATVTGTSTNVTLSPSTTYYWWVRSNCSSTDKGTWISGGSFKTLCNVTPISISQGFNSTTVPSCWSNQLVTVQTGTKISFPSSGTNPFTSPYEGSNMVMYNSYSNDNGGNGSEERLVSLPLSSVGVNSVDVEFYWRNENNPSYNSGNYLLEGVQVQYSTNGGTTWTDAGSFIQRHDSSISSAQWKKKTITIPTALANQANFLIGFKFHSSYGDNLFLDLVDIKPSPSCSMPVATFSSNVVAHNNVNINWSAPSSAPANGYEYYISTTNTTPLASATITGSVGAGITTANITTGTPTTTYYWWVRSNCGASDKSDWAYGGTYTTPLAPCTTPTAQPTALVFGTTSATAINATFTGVASPNTPNGYIILRSLSAVAPTLVNGTTYATSSTQTLGGNQYFVVQGSATASLGTSVANTGLASNTTYYYYVYSFNNACTGQPFYLNTTPLTGSKITCPAPATAATSTVTNTGVSVSWTASVVGGSAETIKYRFELYSDSGRTTLVAGYPLADTVSPVNITTGLTANTTYYYRIIAYNSSCQSTNLDGSFYNGVCIPGTTTNTGYYISNFSTTKGYTANISNLSSGNASGGYQDNFATQKVEMYPTGSFDFSYTNVGGGQAGTSIWVDWNNDWIFDSSETEKVYTSSAYATSGNGTIMVPAGKALGDYRMRVRTERYATSPDNPCSANLIAETEDYKITVVAQPNYVVYTDATTANNTINNTLNIYLKDFDGFNEFYTNDQLEIWMHAGIKTNTGTWLYQNAGQDFNNTSTLIHFIRESTNPNVYKATVKLADWFCIPTGTTVEGLNLVFRNQYSGGSNNQTGNMVLDLTPATVAVIVPTSPASSLVTTTTATISWTAPTTGAVKGFDYYFSTSNTAPTSGTTPSGTVAGNVTTANLASLSPATTYYYWVRTKGCDTNSAWTSVANFTTACAVVTAPTSLQTFDTYLPACWSEATGALTASSTPSAVDGKWFSSTNFGNGTGSNKGAKINLYGTNSDWLISNAINLGATAGQYRISYKMAVTNYNGTTAQTTLGTHQVRIIVSTDGGTTWSNTNVVKTYTGEGAYSNTGTTEYINLIGYSGIVKIAFVSSTTSNSPDVDFHIDDFVVETIPPTLLANNGNSLSLTFADQTITTTSATQSFNLSGLMLTGAPGTITVSAPTGFEVSSVDNATWGTSTTVNYSSATLADKQINVRFKPTDCNAISNATLIINGGGATVIPTVSLSGTGTIPSPTATEATVITDTSFTAHWDAVPGATGYELDVYEKEDVLSNNATIVGWNFDDENVISDEGITVNLSRSITTTAGAIEYSTTSVSGYSAHNGGGWVDGSGTKYWQVSFETTSVSNIKLSSVQRSSNTGPRNFKVQYSVNGTDWFDVSGANINVANNWTTGVLNDISLPSACDNQSLVHLRWIMTSNLQVSSGNVQSSGISRIDNIKIIGDQNINTKTYVSGYNPNTISGGSTISDVVTGLTPDTQYHYVVRAITGTCESADSNEIDVKTGNTVTWSGTTWSNVTGPTATLNSKIVGAYTIAESFETNNLEIASTGSLDIQATKDVTVHGNITLPADNKITVESDGSLVQKNAGADNNSNNSITVKRTALLPTKGYTLWSSPVSGQNLYSFSNGYNQANGGTGTGTPWNRFFIYREASDTFVTSADGITLSSTSTFERGRGYAIRGKNSYTPTGGTGVEVPASADVFTFNGKMNNGSIPSQLLKNSCGTDISEEVCAKGYNLIGNPYPSNLDFDALYNANNSKMYGTAYFWTNEDIAASASQQGSSYSGNNYAIYNMTGGTPAVDIDPDQPTSANPIPNGIVKLGQGFIIKAKKTGLGQPIEFTNAMRVGHDADAPFYNAKRAVKDRFWLKMTSPANIANTILIGYIQGATNGFEIDFDGELFVVGSDSFYSILGNKKLAIQGKSAEFGNEDIIPVGTKYSTNGNYKISLGNKEGIFESEQKIYLKDKLTGSVTDLTAQDYIFAGSKGIDDTRFEIVYKSSEVLGSEGVTKSDFAVYRDGGSFVIRSSFNLGKIELYDVSGKLISIASSSNKEFRLDATSLPSGVYIIRAENAGNIRTKKIIK